MCWRVSAGTNCTPHRYWASAGLRSTGFCGIARERQGVRWSIFWGAQPMGLACVSNEWAARPALVPRQILEQEKAALTCHHEVQIAVAIQVGNRNLHAASGAGAVIDYVLYPFDILAAVQANEFVPVDA